MDVDYNAVDTGGGDPIEELRKKILAGLPVVGLGGGTGAQQAPQAPQATQVPATSLGGPSSAAQPNYVTPVVPLSNQPTPNQPVTHDSDTLPPHKRFLDLKDRGVQNAIAAGQTPPTSDAGKALYASGAMTTDSEGKAPGTPAVKLTNSVNSSDEAAQGDTPEFARNAENAARMFAAARSSGGQSPTQVRSAEDEYRDALSQEPTRDQFSAEKMPVWKRALGILASTAAGAGGGPNAGVETARRFFGAPEGNAEKKFETAHSQWEGKLGNFLKATQLHHQGMEDKNLQSEIDARNQPNAEHAKLADLYADAVKKAVAAGRDPLQDPDVKRYGDSIQNIQRESSGGTHNETPFSVWRQQHPNDDVKEYFKLQPEARNESRPPDKGSRLTAGQKSTLARRYKDALAGIEQEFQERQSGSYVDKRSGELLPPMTPGELTRLKQQAEDAYKDELEAGGEKVSRYDYGAGRSSSNDVQNARDANSSTQHKVGDEVTYKGQRYRIAGIKNGKAQLSPLGSNQ
jgi:hypothetical protein